MKKTDWTRLTPRPRGSSDQQRKIYLVAFLLKARGSEKSKQRAIKELERISEMNDMGILTPSMSARTKNEK